MGSPPVTCSHLTMPATPSMSLMTWTFTTDLLADLRTADLHSPRSVRWAHDLHRTPPAVLHLPRGRAGRALPAHPADRGRRRGQRLHGALRHGPLPPDRPPGRAQGADAGGLHHAG